MKKMTFAMLIAAGVLATGFANAQEKAKTETVKKETSVTKNTKAKKEIKATKTEKIATKSVVKQEKKKEATTVATKATNTNVTPATK